MGLIIEKADLIAMPTLDWSDVPVEPPLVRRSIAVPRNSSPLIAIDVTDVRGTNVTPGGTQIRIIALFRWPTRPERGVQKLWLRKHDLIEERNGFTKAKLLAAEFWGEHKRDEEELLELMWRLPLMSHAELEEYRAVQARRVKEAEERARKMIDARKEQVASTGGFVE